MTKFEKAAAITAALVANWEKLQRHEITPLQHYQANSKIYADYKPDLNTWRKAVKDFELRCIGYTLPMRDC